MVVTSVYNSWDVFYGRDRNVIHRTFENPNTHQKYVEVVLFLYNRNGDLETHGLLNNVDVKA